jgi:hypothetical protein
MKDISLFLQQGWKNIWKQNNIFLFSALPVFINLIYFFSRGRQANPILLFLIPFVTLILFLANAIGVPFMAYRFLIGEPAGNHEVLVAIKKFSARWIGCSCLGLLMISPILLITYFIVGKNSSTPAEWSASYGVLFGLLLLPFGSIFEFCLFGFFANNYDITQSLKKAWSLFTSHFWTLALLSVILDILFRGSSLLSAALTILLQNSFDVTALGQINFLNPGLLLIKNLLYIIISGIFQIVLMPFSALVYGSAYLKYTDVK